jgi:transglutaminase-like putative cysteine protease
MLFDIRQTTFYAYGEAVPSSRHLIRMVPLSRRGQNVIASSLSISPTPHEYREGRDFFGNQETRIAIETPHDTLAVTLTARVDRVSEQDAPWIAALTLPWEVIVKQALGDQDTGPDGPAHYLFPSRMVRLDAAITDYAAQCFAPARPILEAALALTTRIKNEFTYDSTATHVDTDLGEAFAHRHGVCQDFAHIMIAGLRGLGVPARYVSGWLRTEPPPGQKRLEGADTTHAWVAVWCGPAGWIGLDPTNGVRVSHDHIILAEGRDYADIAPLDGIIWSSASHSLSVSVDVVPVEGA